MAEAGDELRPVVWVGTSLEDLKQFPDEVQDEIGYGLFMAQMGDKHRKAKPLKGFAGGGILEMISSKKGIETPKRELELIQRRLKQAEQMDVQATSGGRA